MKRVLWILVILGLAGVGAWRILEVRKAGSAKLAAGAGARGIAVPVIAGVAEARDVPIYLDGLGTIQALNTVTVRARVEGEIQKLSFKEGQEVNEGDLLAQIDPAPLQAALDQALAKLRQDEVQLANARRDLTRDTELIQKKVIAPQQFDTQKAQVAQFEALVKNDEAAVASAKVQLSYARITAPISGRIGLRMMDEGNMVRTSDTAGLLSITQLQPIALVFTLPEQHLATIHRQQQASGGLTVLALARDNKTVLGEGKLTVIDNQIDTATGTIRMKAEFPNTDYQLWPGQFANVRLLVETRKNGVVVPASTIQRGPDSAYVYAIKPDSTVEMRTVKVAQIESGTALVEEGLAAGERVVVDGQYKLQAGSKVSERGSPGAAGKSRAK